MEIPSFDEFYASAFPGVEQSEDVMQLARICYERLLIQLEGLMPDRNFNLDEMAQALVRPHVNDLHSVPIQINVSHPSEPAPPIDLTEWRIVDQSHTSDGTIQTIEERIDGFRRIRINPTIGATVNDEDERYQWVEIHTEIDTLGNYTIREQRAGLPGYPPETRTRMITRYDMERIASEDPRRSFGESISIFLQRLRQSRQPSPFSYRDRPADSRFWYNQTPADISRNMETMAAQRYAEQSIIMDDPMRNYAPELSAMREAIYGEPRTPRERIYYEQAAEDHGWTFTRNSDVETDEDGNTISSEPQQPTWIEKIAAAFTPPEMGFRMQTTEITEYITQLCNQTGQAFEGMDLGWYRDCESRQDINRVFFSKEITKPSVTIDVSNEQKLDALFHSVGPAEKLRTDLNSLRDQFSSITSELNDKMGEIAEMEMVIERLNLNPPPRPSEGIRNVLSQGHWTLGAVESTAVVFHMVNDCILNWRDDSKKMNMTVNLGKFKLAYWPGENKIKVLSLSSNTKSGNYYHPHVAHDSSVCWGNAAQTIQQALKTKDLDKILSTAFLLLNEYNPGSPYRSLDNFFRDKAFEYMGSIKVLIFQKSFDLAKLGGAHSASVVNEPFGAQIAHQCYACDQWKERETGKMFVKTAFGDMVPVQDHWVCWQGENANKNVWPKE